MLFLAPFFNTKRESSYEQETTLSKHVNGPDRNNLGTQYNCLHKKIWTVMTAMADKYSAFLTSNIEITKFFSTIIESGTSINVFQKWNECGRFPNLAKLIGDAQRG